MIRAVHFWMSVDFTPQDLLILSSYALLASEEIQYSQMTLTNIIAMNLSKYTWAGCVYSEH